MNFDEISLMVCVRGITNADTILVMILISMLIQEFCKGIFFTFLNRNNCTTFTGNSKSFWWIV